MSVVVRRAGPADVERLVAVFLRCWTLSYDGVLPEEDLRAWDAERARSFWRAQVDAAMTLTVAEVDGRVQGFARYGADGPTGHLHSLYVDPEAAGHGLGRLLVDHAVTELTALGCQRVSLWVFTRNVAAQAFYRRLGFTDDGRRTHDPGYVSELMGMTRPVAR